MLILGELADIPERYLEVVVFSIRQALADLRCSGKKKDCYRRSKKKCKRCRDEARRFLLSDDSLCGQLLSHLSEVPTSREFWSQTRYAKIVLRCRR